ncbi:hypothetical protein D5396_04655 [Rahnella inusitata]|uniref:Uncharacterized protein n=1 Tax=Rahnella inusitata TaxID=58169 RepID=A0ABX9P1V2_9GAMM|nr:hypothetical protein D5396_04655 [Rahnella inusitata]
MGRFSGILTHGLPLQGQGCGDLVLIAAKSSINSTKPQRPCNHKVVTYLLRTESRKFLYNIIK